MQLKGRPLPLLITGLAACGFWAVLFGLNSGDPAPTALPSRINAPLAMPAKGDRESDAVVEAFEKYRAALLEQDGAEAVRHLSSATLAMYDEQQSWAMSSSKDELNDLAPGIRLQVLILRQRIPVEELRAMDGAAVAAYAVDHGWVGKDGTLRMTIGNVALQGKRATAVASDGGIVHFVRENGEWKFDLTIVLKGFDQLVQRHARERGMSENEVIFSMVTTLSGRQVNESIWKPLE